ncbi:MAG: hypothetical protein MUC36_00650 [Planctomycetes bacterium]|jgi:hypothetical protein|nr:hypothetical protein [Planctomycetota bacterium]
MPTDRFARVLLVTAMAIGLIALGWLCGAPGYHNHDELVLLDRSPTVAEIVRHLADGLFRIDGTFYRPLGHALLRLQLRLHELGPWAVHGASVLHHVANAALFAWVLRRFGRSARPAWWLLVLPTALPGVAWAAAAYDRLLLTWLLLAVGLLRSPRAAAGPAIVAMFLLALATKDTAVVFPVAAVLLWRAGPAAARPARWVPIALAVLAAGYLGWRLANAQPPAIEYEPRFDSTMVVRALRYAAFPFAITTEDPRTVWGASWLLGSAGAALLLAAAWRPRAQRTESMLALALIALPLLPVLPIGMSSGHYLYPATPGLALLLDLALRGGGQALRGGRRAIWCLLPLLTVHSAFVSWHGYRIAVALHGLQRAHRAMTDSGIESVGLTAAPGAAAAVLPRFRYYVTAQGLRPQLLPEAATYLPRLVLQADGSVLTER